MPGLGEACAARRPLQALMHSYFVGPLSFVVGLESPPTGAMGSTWISRE